MSTELSHELEDTSAPAPEPTPVDPFVNTFSAYIAKHLVGMKGYQTGVPEEAAELLTSCDVTLFYDAYGLAIACIVDRETHPERTFSVPQEKLLELGKTCLKYTGSINGAKMPVVFQIYEVGSDSISEADRTRLKALAKMPGLAHVGVTTTYVDVTAKTTWSSAPFNGFFVNRWLKKLLHEPRKSDAELFQSSAAFPQEERKPVVTWTILGVLLAMFVVEQFLRIDGDGPGLLGANVKTLIALGGMNGSLVRESGEWYRLLTAALLHGDLFHILLNGLALWLAGTMLENLVGRAWLLILFLVGALGGSLLGFALNPPELVSVGASGAVMGLLASTLVIATRVPAGAERTQIQGAVLQFLIPSLLPLAVHRSEGQIDYAAHFGGAIAGALAAWAILKIWPRDSEQPRFMPAAKVVAVAVVALFAASVGLVAKSHSAIAEELSIPPGSLLVKDANIPADDVIATRDVEIWGKGYPRDPRVHLFRAFGQIERGELKAAEAELSAALSEEKILKAYFPSGELKQAIEKVLVQVYTLQGDPDDRFIAKPDADRGDR